MWLLDWLVQRWNSVTDWFSDAYWNTRNFIAGIPNSINAIYSTIVSYYYAAVQQLSNSASYVYNNYVKPAFDTLYGYFEDAYSLADDAYYHAVQAMNSISAIGTNIYNSVIAWVSNTYNNIIAGINQNINYILNNIVPNLTGQINSFMQFVGWLQNAVFSLAIDDIKNWIAIYNNYKSVIAAFLANPVGFVLGVIWQYFIEYLCYLIGYALGSTKYELPNIPNWNSKR